MTKDKHYYILQLGMRHNLIHDFIEWISKTGTKDQILKAQMILNALKYKGDNYKGDNYIKWQELI